MFIKRVVMIYERFAIAKKHIAEKVAEDLATQKTINLTCKELNQPELDRDKVIEQLRQQQ